MDLAAQVEALPTTPGVYLFKAPDGEVLYVGKAVSLRARVRQYLHGHDERYMVPLLVAAAARVEAVPVANEKEALLLENSLIKQHQPRYNVKLRDDKNFLHIRVDPRASWPRLTLVRKPRDDGARYFGPYHSATSARYTLAFVQRHFALRTCTDAVLRTRRRPCLLYQMSRCIAPCASLCSTEQYTELLGDAMLFLGGRDKDLLRRLSAKMEQEAEALRFEDAARTRDLLKAVQSSLDRQTVADVKLGDRDGWGMYREGVRGVVACLPMRGGLAREPHLFRFDAENDEDGAVLAGVMNGWYAEVPVPPEVLVPVAVSEALREVLEERRGGRVAVTLPQRGDKTRLLQIAASAAQTHYQTTWSEEDRARRALDGLAELLGLEAPPFRIECFDNSNLLGEDPVASQVVFLEGRPARAEYRRYKVKTVVGADDFATMREILGRRLRRAAEDGNFPDLLVVDGGRGQLSAAEDVLRELGLEDQPVIGLAKPRTEHRRGDRDAVDKIILRDRAEPVVLRYDDPTLRLLQHLRDEAHDTAIGFHRKTRSRSALKSSLEEIPGIGPARRKALLLHFGSLNAVRGASVHDLAAVPGLGPAAARRLHAALHPGTGEKT